MADEIDLPVRKRTARIELLEEADRIEAAYRAQSEKSFMVFARGLTIASQTGPKVLENCIAPFQRECFDDLAPNLHAVREGSMPEMRRFWIERTKKASKDADLAVVMMWLLCFPRRPLYMQVGAANREQGAIVKERMTHLLHWNPWLNDHINIVQWEARSRKTMSDGSPMAKMNIMSSDIAGAHGGTPDVLIINELSHVARWEFVENLMDNADGVAQGLVLVATNAGVKGSKAEVWRNNALTSDDWSTHILAEPAPWHSPKTIADAERRNPPSRFRRLWKGLWTSGKGDALSEEDIDRCFVDENGKERVPGPLNGPEPGWFYIGGLDLGISHDHSALVILGVNVNERLIKVAWMKSWAPVERKDKKKPEVDLISVKDTCKSMCRVFRCSSLFYDPHQAKLMSQELIRDGIMAREMSFGSPGNLTRMAETLLQVIETHRLACYDDKDGLLRRDFGKINIVEKNYGYKIEAVSDEYGHADIGAALVIALPAAVDMLNGNNMWCDEDDLYVPEEDELSDEEIELLPSSLKSIVEVEHELKEERLVKTRSINRDPFEDIY